ncbi:MAG: DUF6599 family protein [Planctomycetota bacterium]
MARVRRIVQALIFVVFIAMLIHAAGMTRAGTWALPDLFLRLSPLSAATTMLGAKTFIARYIPAIGVLVLAVVFGRFFCGWVCPLGSTLDATDKALSRARKGRQAGFYDGRRLKYYLLGFLLVGAPLGIAVAGWFDPLSIATRSYGLTVLPYTVWLSDGVALGLQDLPTGGLGALWDRASHVILAETAAGTYQFHVLFFLIFLAIVAFGVWYPRYWCRNLCPLGAMLGLASQKHLLKRAVSDQCISCHKCQRICPMGCITDDGKGTMAGECILCLRCQEVCPTDAIRFIRRQPAGQEAPVDLSKRGFVDTLGTTAVALPLLRLNVAQQRYKDRLPVLRPPGARDEEEFLSRCVRCGECMRVCPTRALQPAGFESGVEGLWTPTLVPRTGYCVYNCNLCGQVCPSQALAKLTLEEKHKRAMGKAKFNRSRCIPWRGWARFREGLDEWEDCNCGTCEEACPVAGKAIRYNRFVGEVNGTTVHIDRPYVVEDLCVGCGFCENVCPVAGEAAIRVEGPAGTATIAEEVASPAEPSLDLAAAFPGEVAGWTRQREPGVYVGGKGLYDLIDGAGEPYLTFAFVQIGEGRYVQEQMELNARVWQFATPQEAYGGYTYEVSRAAQETADLGHAAARSQAELWVWQGDLFIHIADYGQDYAPAEAFPALAKALLAQLPSGEAKRPDVVKALPQKDLNPVTIAYFHDAQLAVPDRLPRDLVGSEALGITRETPAAFAGYGPLGEETHFVVVVEYGDAAAAKAAVERCRTLREAQKVAGEADEPAVFQVGEGNVEAFVHQGRRAGAVVRAGSAERARQAARQLADAIKP